MKFHLALNYPFAVVIKSASYQKVFAVVDESRTTDKPSFADFIHSCSAKYFHYLFRLP